MSKNFLIALTCFLLSVVCCKAEDKITVQSLFEDTGKTEPQKKEHEKNVAKQDVVPAAPVTAQNAPAATNPKDSGKVVEPAPDSSAVKTEPVPSAKASPAPAANVTAPQAEVKPSVPSEPASASQPPAATAKKLTNEEFIKELNDLQNQRRKVSLDIYKMRIKLIQNNPDLRILQKTIIGLHEKMAKQLNSDPKMQNLLAKAQEIDKKMYSMVNSQK